MKSRFLWAGILCILTLSAMAAATWEGNAVVGVSADFPEDGLFAACNSFPKGSSIEVRNLENGKLVKVRIAKGIDNPGVFLVLSPKAGAELGMTGGVSTRIRANVLSSTAAPPSATATGASDSTDPDFNPRLLAAQGRFLPTEPGTAASSPSATMSTNEQAVAGTQPATTLPAADQAARGAVFEPEKATLLGGETPSSPSLVATQPDLAEALPPSMPEVERPVILADESPASPAVEGAAPAAPEALPSAVPPILPPIETATVEGAGPDVPPVESSGEVALAEAQPPTLKVPDAATMLGGENPVPAMSTATEEPLALAEAPIVSGSETGQLIGGDSPSAPAVANQETSLSEAELPNDGQASVPDGEAVATESDSGSIADATSPGVTVEESADIASLERSPAPATEAGDGTLTETPIPDMPSAAAESEATVAGPAEIALSMEPAAPRPPVAVGMSGTTEGGTPANPGGTVPQPAISAKAQSFPTPPAYVERLEAGSYYVQVAVFGSGESLATAALGFAPTFPVVAERISGKTGELFRLYIGPVARDESGLLILKLKALGFRDAFLRKGQ